eukprot:GGOE01005800.1.p3 GENE.GGOE01005800.1~~GGOE01005800.1.p3  ORF type:complete len:126 (-),score=3.86 GGOE01005800.1:276-653(-)
MPLHPRPAVVPSTPPSSFFRVVERPVRAVLQTLGLFSPHIATSAFPPFPPLNHCPSFPSVCRNAPHPMVWKHRPHPSRWCPERCWCCCWSLTLPCLVIAPPSSNAPHPHYCGSLSSLRPSSAAPA